MEKKIDPLMRFDPMSKSPQLCAVLIELTPSPVSIEGRHLKAYKSYLVTHFTVTGINIVLYVTGCGGGI